MKDKTICEILDDITSAPLKVSIHFKKRVSPEVQSMLQKMVDSISPIVEKKVRTVVFNRLALGIPLSNPLTEEELAL